MLDPVAMEQLYKLTRRGLKVKIETYEWNAFLGVVNPGLEGKADMAEMAWMTNDPLHLPFLALRTGAWPDKGGSTQVIILILKLMSLEVARASTGSNERSFVPRNANDRSGRCLGICCKLKQNAVTSIKSTVFHCNHHSSCC